jgi:hypothetical protein
MTLSIHGGDLSVLRLVLDDRPELAPVRMIDRKGPEGGRRTPPHAGWGCGGSTRSRLGSRSEAVLDA